MNCIADALNQSVQDGDFVVRMNSIADAKFPVFVVHTVVVEDLTTGRRIVKRRRVHSKDTNEHVVKRGLLAEVISTLLVDSAEGKLPTVKNELKF